MTESYCARCSILSTQLEQRVYCMKLSGFGGLWELPVPDASTTIEGLLRSVDVSVELLKNAISSTVGLGHLNKYKGEAESILGYSPRTDSCSNPVSVKLATSVLELLSEGGGRS